MSTITSDFRYLDTQSFDQLAKEVTQVEVSYYPFKWIDTQSISMFDFG